MIKLFLNRTVTDLKAVTYISTLCFLVMLFVSNLAFAQPVASWSTPPELVSLNGQTSSVPRIAVSADGTVAIAAWLALDNGSVKVQTRLANISGNTATWSSTINAHAEGNAPRIAISDDGTKATLMWFDNVDPWIVKSRSATISGSTVTWGVIADIYVGNSIVNYLEDPSIELSADGSMATAVWADTPPMSGKIVMSNSATISGNTATWGTVTNLHTSGQDPRKPDLALSADGATAIVTWARSNGVDSLAQTTIATISGNVATWGAVEDVSPSGQSTYDAEVAISADGTKASVIWGASTISEPQIKNRTATITGGTATWGAVTSISTEILQSFDAVSISLSDDGSKAASIWYGTNGTSIPVQSSTATISGNNATWSTVQEISDSGSNNYLPLILISGNGSVATALWVRIGSGEEIVQSRSATLAGNIATWGSAVDLSTAAQFSYLPDFGHSSNGLMGTAVWNANIPGSPAASEIQSSSFVLSLPTPTATPTAIPNPNTAPEITVINHTNSGLGTPQVESSSRGLDGRSEVRACINFSRIRGTANIYGIAKKSGSRKNLIFKRIRRADPCFTFRTSQTGVFEMFFRWDRYQKPSIFSKRLRIRIN